MITLHGPAEWLVHTSKHGRELVLPCYYQSSITSMGVLRGICKFCFIMPIKMSIFMRRTLMSCADSQQHNPHRLVHTICQKLLDFHDVYFIYPICTVQQLEKVFKVERTSVDSSCKLRLMSSSYCRCPQLSDMNSFSCYFLSPQNICGDDCTCDPYYE